MKTRLPLSPDLFAATPRISLENTQFSVTLFRYPSGIEAITLENSEGRAIVLPYYGQMIWDVNFAGRSLTMGNS